MSKHTKGPWKTATAGRRALTGPEGQPVVFYGDGIVIGLSSPSEEAEANYKLLVAAPEMFEILTRIWEVHRFAQIREFMSRFEAHVCVYRPHPSDEEKRCSICQKLMPIL